MDLLFILHLLNALLMILWPFALGLWLSRRLRLGWRLWWIGAATFVLAQAVHIPFNTLILAPLLARIAPVPQPGAGLLLVAVALGLSAGLFESFARYIMYRWPARDARSWRKGVMAGAGHGGIEAAILGALALVAFFQLTALRNADLSKVVPPEQLDLARQQIAAYWSATPFDALLGAVERVFTLPCHIALSLLVLESFLRRQARWLWLAVGWHTLLDASTVYAGRTLGVYATEAVVGVMALLSLGIIFALRRPDDEPEPPPGPDEAPPVPAPLELPPTEVTLESLQRSRYL